jgi:hypothetical protein
MSSQAEHIEMATVDVPAGGSARLPRLIRRLAALGARPEDTEEGRLRKGTLILASSLITVLSVTWVATYFALGRPVSAAIPFAYQVATVAGLFWLVRTKRFAGFRLSQLLMMLMLPCLLQVTLGGFVPSSGVVLWAAFAPIGALMLLRAAPRRGRPAQVSGVPADLLRDVGDEALGELPEPQLRALDVALLRAEPVGLSFEQRAISSALLGILASLASSQPLLVAVDDVQWLDGPTERVLRLALCQRGRKSSDVVFVVVGGQGHPEPVSADTAHDPCVA